MPVIIAVIIEFLPLIMFVLALIFERRAKA
jgi:hypothetical protein